MTSHNHRGAVAESRVKEYLDSFANSNQTTRERFFPRVVCCNTSQSLYCKECCRLLVPEDSLPLPIHLRRKHACNDTSPKNNESKISIHERKGQVSVQSGDLLDEGPLRLPFDLHLILDDRRGSSTGIHAVALLDTARQKALLGEDGATGTHCKKHLNSSGDVGTVTLTDVAKLDAMEQSGVLDDAMNLYADLNSGEYGPSTFFLFPCPRESVPLKDVSNQVKCLVVLDCKWTKSGVWQRSAKLRHLPKVHLSHPPTQSHFWRCKHSFRTLNKFVKYSRCVLSSTYLTSYCRAQCRSRNDEHY
ncbi:hypothetical protein ACHAWX_000810 [Stephanocyclus meneghinianus]